MVFITGDVHGLNSFYKFEEFVKGRDDLSKNDYMIIAGDCGILWDEKGFPERLVKYQNLPFTTLFVDGNHENFDMLNAYPVQEWKGGKVHIIAPDVIHLMRGQVFEIDGKTIFTLGGATSIDKYLRTAGISWWEEELPTADDLDEGLRNLAHYDNKVDVVVTHSCDERALYYLPMRTPYNYFKPYPENVLLNTIEERVEYQQWYFGHYHIDGDVTDKKTALYDDILKIV